MQRLDLSPIFTPAALGNMPPAVQALYENAHRKLRDGDPLLPSERVPLEERLSELRDDYDPPEDGILLPPRWVLVLVLNYAHQAAQHHADPHDARALLTWLIQAEELRARLELHIRLWQGEDADA